MSDFERCGQCSNDACECGDKEEQLDCSSDGKYITDFCLNVWTFREEVDGILVSEKFSSSVSLSNLLKYVFFKIDGMFLALKSFLSMDCLSFFISRFGEVEGIDEDFSCYLDYFDLTYNEVMFILHVWGILSKDDKSQFEADALRLFGLFDSYLLDVYRKLVEECVEDNSM